VHFGIVREVRADGPRLAVTGEVDLESAAELRRRLLRAVHAHDLVVLDLSGVTFMDSQGLGVLIRADAEARARGAVLHVAAASRPVRRLLALTQLTGLLLPDSAA
jgi:anti-sigma B factor antagonist